MKFELGDQVIVKSTTTKNLAFYNLTGKVVPYDASEETPSVYLVELENGGNRFFYEYEISRYDGKSIVPLTLEEVKEIQGRVDNLIQQAQIAKHMGFYITHQDEIAALQFKLINAAPSLIKIADKLTNERDDARAVLRLIESETHRAIPDDLSLWVADLQQSLEEIRALCIGALLNKETARDQPTE